MTIHNSITRSTNSELIETYKEAYKACQVYKGCEDGSYEISVFMNRLPEIENELKKRGLFESTVISLGLNKG